MSEWTIAKAADHLESVLGELRVHLTFNDIVSECANGLTLRQLRSALDQLVRQGRATTRNVVVGPNDIVAEWQIASDGDLRMPSDDDIYYCQVSPSFTIRFNYCTDAALDRICAAAKFADAATGAKSKVRKRHTHRFGWVVTIDRPDGIGNFARELAWRKPFQDYLREKGN
jgi:hypothetical protein